MAVAKYLSPTMLALASLQLVAGLATKYPEVVPGPGLPSLASLGLTSEMLYKMPKPDLCTRETSQVFAKHQSTNCHSVCKIRRVPRQL